MKFLHNAGVERFKRQALGHLRQRHAEVCQPRSDAEPLHYIDSMLAFCRAAGVTQQPNVLRMFDLQMQHAWAPPLEGYLAWRLAQPCYDEGSRVAHFAHALTLQTLPVVIGLDTPLPELEARHG